MCFKKQNTVAIEGQIDSRTALFAAAFGLLGVCVYGANHTQCAAIGFFKGCVLSKHRIASCRGDNNSLKAKAVEEATND